ncbi:MAG: branched-chain amino acid aminotransferase [Flavobacteriales bacterium]|nr:branched-chain amino acid aminotransferase [Flavobacteriales bacterium]
MITETLEIKIQKVADSRLQDVDFDNLPFGKVFSDHMFIMEYREGKWEQARIEGYRALSMTPAMSVLHYGQAVFEGMKAYRNSDNEVLLFRPEDNAKRLNQSAERMCMPEIPVELFMEGLTKLIDIDRDWVPQNPGSALYIRPFMIAIDEYVGIRPSDTYAFIIFTCPVNQYYSEPLNVKIEEEYTRAAPGGVGAAKAAGNYAASLYPAKLAQDQGFRQLIWTDAIEHKYIEESGTMNVCFIIGDKLITPKSSDTILSGITRNSVTRVAKEWGLTVEERKVTVEEIVEAMENGTLKDCFGAGTAATIAQIASINYRGKDYALPEVKQRDFSNKVYAYLDDLKNGRIEDPFGWTVRI